MIFKLVAGTLVGYAAHGTRNMTLKFGARLGALLRYGIGTVAMLPVMLLFLDSKQREQATLAYIAGATSVGMGVLVGYMVDSGSHE